jgi:hypothetical protein
LENDAGGNVIEGAEEGASAGVAVTPAAEVFGYAGDVKAALATDAEAKSVTGGEFAEEDGGLNTGHADEVTDEALAVLDDGVCPV